MGILYTSAQSPLGMEVLTLTQQLHDQDEATPNGIRAPLDPSDPLSGLDLTEPSRTVDDRDRSRKRQPVWRPALMTIAVTGLMSGLLLIARRKRRPATWGERFPSPADLTSTFAGRVRAVAAR